MCTYTLFTFLCGSKKLKIAAACHQMSINVQGIPFCRLDPHAHHADGNQNRVYGAETFGPGICANEACRKEHGLLSSKGSSVGDVWQEDDSEYDMSPEACAEREDRWYRQCLTTEQQLDYMSITFPIPYPDMSIYAQTWIYSDQVSDEEWWSRFEDFCKDLSPDCVKWQELNPRYMTAHNLRLVTGVLLPASVTDTSGGKSGRGSSPRQPAFGPFKPKPHACKPEVGLCRTCGTFHGKEFKGKGPQYHSWRWDDIPAETKSAPLPPNLIVHGNDLDRKLAKLSHSISSQNRGDEVHQKLASDASPAAADTPTRAGDNVIGESETFEGLANWRDDSKNLEGAACIDGDEMVVDG